MDMKVYLNKLFFLFYWYFNLFTFVLNIFKKNTVFRFGIIVLSNHATFFWLN